MPIGLVLQNHCSSNFYFDEVISIRNEISIPINYLNPKTLKVLRKWRFIYVYI